MKWVIFDAEGILALDEEKEGAIQKVMLEEMLATGQTMWDYVQEKRKLKIMPVTDTLADLLTQGWEQGDPSWYVLQEKAVLCTVKEVEAFKELEKMTE